MFKLDPKFFPPDQDPKFRYLLLHETRMYHVQAAIARLCGDQETPPGAVRDCLEAIIELCKARMAAIAPKPVDAAEETRLDDAMDDALNAMAADVLESSRSDATNRNPDFSLIHAASDAIHAWERSRPALLKNAPEGD